MGSIWLIVRLQGTSVPFSGATATKLMGNRPADFVLSEEGAVLQGRLWEQTMEILSAIEPEIARAFS
jgi:hypothetical protein